MSTRRVPGADAPGGAARRRAASMRATRAIYVATLGIIALGLGWVYFWALVGR